MTAAINVTPKQHKIILDLLRRHLPDTTAWVYGSRVKGTTRTCSDLDMVVFSAPEQQLQVSNLREAFEESSLPFKVDLFVWDDLPENFKKNIEAEAAMLTEKRDKAAFPEWAERTIGEVAEIVGGGTPSSKVKEFWGGDIAWLTPKDLSGYPYRRIKKGERNITDVGLAKSSARLLPENTVLVTSRAPVGYVAIADAEIATNQGFKSLILKEGYDPEFFYYLIKHNVPKLEAASSGTTFKEISGKAIQQIRFDIPPYPEQRAIAHILGSLDDKIEHNRRMNETLEAMAQALFKSWFVNFDPVIDNALAAGNPIPEPLQARAALRKNLGNARKPLPDNIRRLFPAEFSLTKEMGWTPTGWEEETLGNIVDIAKGRNITKASTKNGLVPVVAGGLSPAYYHDTANVNGPVVTISASGANAGYVNLYYEDIWASDCSYINNMSFEHLYYIYLTLKSKQKEISGLQKGSAQPHVYPRDLKKLSVLVPQNEIVKIFEELVAHNFHNIAALIKKNRLLEKLRDILLPKLLSGEIRIPDAENGLGEVS